MTNKETIAIVYRLLGSYPTMSRHLTDEMVEDMIREWHEGLKNVSRDGAMEAVTALVSEQKWMPSLSEVLAKILDMQYGTESDIIRDLDRAISRSSTCIIFGQVTEEQEEGYKRLTPFQKLIIQSPYEFNLWLTKDYEWKEERVKRIKREIQGGGHRDALSGNQQGKVGFDVFKALEERKNGQVTERKG